MSAAYLRSTACPPSSSGRFALPHHHGILFAPTRQLRAGSQRAQTNIRSLYNFTDSAEVRVPGQRRNRGLLKKEAREVMGIVRGLTSMSPKQLAAVEHLLPPGTLDAVGVAARLPRSNQGRKRQEGLVAKLLRGQLSELQMDKLEAAVTVATERRGVYDDGDVSGLVEVWREGLLAGDQAVVAEVYGYPSGWAPDHQQLRALVRQCQQALEEEAEHEAAVARERERQEAAWLRAADSLPSASNAADTDRAERRRYGTGINNGDDGDEEEEDLAAVLAEAAARSGTGGGRRRSRKLVSEPRSRGLERSLGKMLRPLALRVVQEGLGGG